MRGSNRSPARHAAARAPDDGRRGARLAGAVAGLREDAHAVAARCDAGARRRAGAALLRRLAARGERGPRQPARHPHALARADGPAGPACTRSAPAPTTSVAAPAPSWTSSTSCRACSCRPNRKRQVFHIVQEALTNVARHAHAQHALAAHRSGRRASRDRGRRRRCRPAADGRRRHALRHRDHGERARRLAGDPRDRCRARVAARACG